MTDNEQYKASAQHLIDLQRSLNDLREKNQAVFAEYDRLLEARTVMVESLKEQSRNFAVQGKIVLVDQDVLRVEVIKQKPRLNFIWAKAEKAWPKSVLTEVMVCEIDPKKVAEQVRLGYLSTEKALQAQELQPPPEPAVSIKFFPK